MGRHVFVLSAAVLALAGGARAGPAPDWSRGLAPAQAAAARGDMAAAYAAYERVAARNPVAAFMLGRFRQEGWGRPRDPVAACTWFERAARRQVPAAEHFWADCLAQGIGRPAQPAQAIVWYGKAAGHGHLISSCSAGELYLRGEGVPKDAARGLALCMQAAQSNSPPAMLALARYFDEGRHVPQDLPAARNWYLQAAQGGVVQAQYRLGAMLSAGEGGPVDADTGLYWLETAASQGMAEAYLPTAMLYANAVPQEKTGALAPEHLAKVYLWVSAARARCTDASQQAQAQALEKQVLKVMPASWRASLDKQVAEHLAGVAK